LPAVQSQDVPTIPPISFIPPPDGVVVQMEILRDLATTLPIIQQQDGVCPPRNPVILALSMDASLKFATLCRGKKTRTYHAHTGIAARFRVNPENSAFS